MSVQPAKRPKPDRRKTDNQPRYATDQAKPLKNFRARTKVQWPTNSGSTWDD
jgi:hypothetical protein